MLRLARICTAALGCGAILIAVLWSDIIGLLLLTYHLWAPAIILPVCVGALSKHRSKWLNTRVFVTMLIATLATLAYRGLKFAHEKYDWNLLGDRSMEYVEVIDASVFGVGASCIIFLSLSLFPSTGAVSSAK